ncbi:AEC family transporter [Streptomyces huiliensis]|uniref:AEC family transporter n=1 Tax=Streptomyces huiliensis TaxID=2876027 RepID=UPI001CC0A0D7|nr:AEC family transporter [Streptomyces huiliensis]MBZ4317791.1 AEC family transporter [Streptomyces huiliensis]
MPTPHALSALLAAFVPLWALTGVGWLAGRTGLLGADAEDVLGRFVFNIAMPAALFTLLARTPLGGFANASMLAFASGTAAALLLGAVAARRLFHRKPAEQVVGGLAAGYVNSGNLGIPVATQVLGDASVVAPVILFQVLVVTPLMLAVLGAGTGEARRRAGRALLAPVRNPIVLAAAAGGVCSAAHWRLPGALDGSCDLLGRAGVPTALVMLGLSLHGRRRADDGTTAAGSRAEVGVAVALKTLLQPAAAYATGRYALHLPPHQLLATVVCSALPTAQNVYVYAREYGAAGALARDAVVVSTLVSMATLSGFALLLTPGG